MKTLTDDEYDTLLAKAREGERLHALVNTPELVNFAHGVHLEAVHQEERWGAEDRRSKGAAEWFWLVGHLAGRALEHDKEADRLLAEAAAEPGEAGRRALARQIARHREKAVHHTITTAAALNHWHAGMLRKAHGEPADVPSAANSDVAPLATAPMPLRQA